MGDSSPEMVAPEENENENEEGFGFAFNDSDFSDRVLRLVIIPDNESIASGKKLKGGKYKEWFSSINADCGNDPKTPNTRKRKAKDSGPSKTPNTRRRKAKDSECDLHINSAILASKSPFFYKLFKNGMRESQQGNEVSLRINASEKATLMDLLNFMYGNKLYARSATELVQLLIAADKFEVISCMKYSIQMLLKLPMSLEDAVLYLELPSSVLVSEIVQPLIDEAKKYVAAHFKDFKTLQKEAMKLPLSALEVVLGSEGLQVDSEDDIFNFILKWARVTYPDQWERREILTYQLSQFVCFSNMSSSKLKEVLACPDFDHYHASRLVTEALFSKVNHSYGQPIDASKNLTPTYHDFSGRVYRPSCVVYFNLKKDELQNQPTQPSWTHLQNLQSNIFRIGDKKFFLKAERNAELDQLGLFVLKTRETKSCTVDYEFGVMKNSSKAFERRFRVKNHTFVGELGWGTRNLLNMTWAKLMSGDHDYFIDDVLHIRAEIILVNKSPQP